MADIIARLLNMDLVTVRAVFDGLYSVLLLFALKRKKMVSSAKVIQDDLQALIDYHKKTASKLESLQKKEEKQKKEGE